MIDLQTQCIFYYMLTVTKWNKTTLIMTKAPPLWTHMLNIWTIIQNACGTHLHIHHPRD